MSDGKSGKSGKAAKTGKETNVDSEKDLIIISGVVNEVIYKNEDNGYTVCDIEADDGDFFTAVGIMPFLSEGEAVKVYGNWTVHANFGRQFAVESAEACLPVGAVEILRYLSSGAIKGIGPVIAKRIVERYGEDTFDIIENHPDWLAEINGISKKKAKEISKTFIEHTGSRSVMMFCRDYFGPSVSMKIYKAWGSAAVDIIRKNPYRLCGEIGGIGFAKADEIAVSLGVDPESDERIEGAIVYLLTYNASANGHVFLPYDRVVEGTAELISVDPFKVIDAVKRMTSKRKLFCRRISFKNGETVEACYLDTYYKAEKETAHMLCVIDKASPAITTNDAERFIKMLEIRDDIEYASGQREAIKDALIGGVMVLTGSPGTGKTTVVRALIDIFGKLGMKDIELAAPTGRAAKRMTEATGVEARTIHRMLEMEYNDNSSPRFARNETNRLDADVIIIDEASMIDILLMRALLAAVRPGTRVILIGDSNQLSSVGAGNVLWDLIDSGVIRTAKLTEIFRQAKESFIITNAAKIINGELPVLTEKKNDFFFMARNSDDAIAKTIVELCVRRLPAAYGDEISEGIQIISPSRKGAAGTEMLNAYLQAELNPPDKKKKEKKSREITFREGDRVMQIKNNYKLEWYREGAVTISGDEKPDGIGIFNGDIGIIESIDPEREEAKIRFDDKYAYYDFSLFDELDHAYAVTVHKSQGSEYPVVIIPMYGCSPRLMTRHLLYTAVTRASKMVILVGREDVITRMVECEREDFKYTGLSLMLREENDGIA